MVTRSGRKPLSKYVAISYHSQEISLWIATKALMVFTRKLELTSISLLPTIAHTLLCEDSFFKTD